MALVTKESMKDRPNSGRRIPKKLLDNAHGCLLEKAALLAYKDVLATKVEIRPCVHELKNGKLSLDFSIHMVEGCSFTFEFSATVDSDRAIVQISQSHASTVQQNPERPVEGRDSVLYQNEGDLRINKSTGSALFVLPNDSYVTVGSSLIDNEQDKVDVDLGGLLPARSSSPLSLNHFVVHHEEGRILVIEFGYYKGRIVIPKRSSIFQ